MFDYTDIAALAANYTAAVVRLSPGSLALLLSTNDLTTLPFHWLVSGEQPTETEENAIDDLVSQAYFELMRHILIGTIFPFASASPPDGALECDGATYNRADYPDLYTALDGIFIVDADHFIVPDLRGRTVLGVGSGTGLSTYAMGDTGGEEAHTLITAETPSHSHTVIDPGHTHAEGIAVPAVTALVGAPVPVPVPAIGVTGPAFTGITLANTGGDGAHENRPPYFALRYAIWGV